MMKARKAIPGVILENWGDTKYIELIEASGDVQTVLGVTQTELCGMVEQYVRNAAG